MKTNSSDSGSLHVLVAIAAVVFVLVALGVLFYLNIVTKPKNTDATNTQGATSAIKPGTAQTTSGSEQGWRIYTSKKFGISFTVPSYWQITEANPDTADQQVKSGTGYVINVRNPNDSAAAYTFTVTTGDAASQARQTAETMNKLQGFIVTTTPFKWHDYDAVRLTSSLQGNSGKPLTLDILYVQVGSYIYNIPDNANVANDTSDSSTSHQLYDQFVGSIQIKNK